MNHEPLVKDFMTLQPQTIESKEPLEAAEKLMTLFGIRHLPVTDTGIVVGILSERELKAALETESAELKQLFVIDICSQKPYIISPDTPLRDVAGVMAREHLGSAIIMENAKLVGIFTTVDACRALHDLIEKAMEGANIENLRSMRFLLGSRG